MLRVVSVVLATSLICGLFLLPEVTIHFFWGIAIPLLPATFLVSPAIWRSVCPLATFNKSGNQLNPRQSLSRDAISKASAISVLLLFVLVEQY